MNLMRTAMRLAASPRGRRVLHQAKRWAERPENREKIASVVDRARQELRGLQDQRGRGSSGDRETPPPDVSGRGSA